MGDADISYFEKNPDKVLKHLDTTPCKSRKTILASLVTLTGNGKYKDRMMKDAYEYQNEKKDQHKTEKETDNWLTQEDVLKVWKELYRNYYLLSKATLTPEEKDRLQNLVILSLFVLIPPRRSLDYCDMKIRNIDKENDNYIEGRKLVFMKYKTAKNYGEQKVAIPPKLQLLLKKWVAKQQGDFLLSDSQGKPMTPSKLTVKLNKIFGKRISTNMLRKIYLTDKYKDVPALKDMEETSREMGHSVMEALTSYVKK
jgi:integrase